MQDLGVHKTKIKKKIFYTPTVKRCRDTSVTAKMARRGRGAKASMLQKAATCPSWPKT